MRETAEKDLRKIEERVFEIETAFGSLEEFVLRSTFGVKKHTLRKTAFSSGKCFQDYPQMSEFELAELNDFWAGENGDFETW